VRQVLLLLLLPLLLFGVCGAGPARKGLEGTVNVGYGEYEYVGGRGGCGGPSWRYQAREGMFHIRVRHRGPSGFTVAAEGGTGSGRLHSAQLEDPGDEENPGHPPELDQQRNVHLVGLRLGYHGSWFGAELGPGLLLSDSIYDRDALLLPSAEAWIGVPDVAYVWGGFLTGPIGRSSPPFGFGLGHTGDRLHLTAGITGPDEHDTLRLEGDVRVVERLWVGAGFRRDLAGDWSVLARLRF